MAVHGDLPEGVFSAHTAYALKHFELSDAAHKDLESIEKITGRPVVEVWFRAEEVEQAQALGAAHGESWQTIIVGNDVANQLVSDQLARQLKEYRVRIRREREQLRRHAGDAEPNADNDTASNAEADKAGEEEARRAQREAERKVREQATAFNLELGRAVYGELSRVKVDDRVLKVIASIDLSGKLGETAMRGARYGFPGWVREETQRNGKTKRIYVDQRADAARRAGEYLLGARTAGEIVGRQLALVAMAVYADENAVAQSNRSWHTIHCEGPWAQGVGELLDELVREKLPHGAVALLEPRLQERASRRAEIARQQHERQEALSRLDGAEDRIPQLEASGLEQVKRDLDTAWTGWNERQSALRQLVRTRENELAAEPHEQ